MNVKEIKEFDKKRYKVSTDEGISFVIYKGELADFKLNEDSEISDEMWTKIESTLLLRCKKRVLHILEKSPKTVRQLQDKLKEGGYPQELADAAIEYAASFGYVNDAKYAADYVRVMKETRSKLRITMDLKKKGVSDKDIERALEEEYTESDVPKISELLRKRGYDSETADEAMKAKQYRYFLGKGYKSGDILKALKSDEW